MIRRANPGPRPPVSKAAVHSSAITTGKAVADEDYPFGSRLVSRRLRPHVAAFYRFARHADDIADDPALAAAGKHARLEALAAVLTGRRAADADTATAAELRRSRDATGMGPRHALDLLAAFHRDADNPRCADWDALMDYCRLSAVPVGRFLLDLHGEGARTHAAGDALCAAVQILNHLQDCAADRRALDRVYLPLDRLAAEGLDPAVLDAPACAPALRRVLDGVLDEVDALLATARPLPRLIADRRLALEAAVILSLAVRMARHLRRADPLRRRVRLPWTAAVGGTVSGLLHGSLGR